jgi:ABC-2 type transport system ATP-binding protein
MPEFMTLYERMSGWEFLEFLGILYDIEQDQLRLLITNYLNDFELVKAADRLIGSYSQGMKRKISLIGTLIKGSSILLLDEPTNGLDPTGIIKVKELLQNLAGTGKTVIVSTHILGMAEQLCDRVGVIAAGHLLFVGTITELRERTRMEHASLEDIFISLMRK